MATTASKKIDYSKMSFDEIEALYKDRDWSALDPRLQEELDEKGLVPMWVAYDKIAKSGGRYGEEWEVYRDSKVGNSLSVIKDAEGLIRRGDLVLAVRDKNLDAYFRHGVEKRRRELNDAVDRASGKVKRELGEISRKGNLRGSVLDEDELD